MYFSDIHTHLLYNTDDGAKTYEDMIAMVDLAYKKGTRFLCATPHFDPASFGDNREAALMAFEELSEYCREKYPNLELCLGNELFYMKESGLWLMQGLCRTIGRSHYVLVEFDVDVTEKEMDAALYRLLNRGYTPIIAHAERYVRVRVGKLAVFSKMGVLIQANPEMLFSVSYFARRRLHHMLKRRLVDFISSDGHDCYRRAPVMNEAYQIICEKYSKAYAKAICCENALRLFSKRVKAEVSYE